MDIATVGGIVLGFLVILLGIFASQGELGYYIDPASVFVTLGGSIAATFVSHSLARMMKLGRVLKVAFIQERYELGDVIQTIVSFSERARREGLLALEDDVEELMKKPEYQFLGKGIQLVVDGTDPELVRNIMEAELSAMMDRHNSWIKILEDFGYLAPAFGMIGTLIGLIIMLQNLGGDKSAIGAGMAVALITTLYGAIVANLVAIPIANKLTERNDEEVLVKEIMIAGVLSIQAGENPRIVKEKLMSYLPPEVRKELQEQERAER